MHLTALVESTDHVCCRYRVTALAAGLADYGHTLVLRPLPRRWWEWFALKDLTRADAVLLQRKLPARWQLRLLRRAARRLVFDFDDAVFLRDSYSPKGLRSSWRWRRFQATVAASDLIVAGNEFLATAARASAGSRRVAVIPTCVDPARYRVADPQLAGLGARLVWIGSSSTLRGLEAVRSMLEALGDAWPDLELKIISDRPLELTRLRTRFHRWSEATEAAELAEADIGISWIPDDDWSRGKCGLKVLQYMAAGLPVVVNPVGVQADMVRHGENGYHARSVSEWIAAVGCLAHDARLRHRFGLAGRRRVEREFSVAVGTAHWAELLNWLSERRQAA